MVSPAASACATWISTALLILKAASSPSQAGDWRALRGWAATCGVKREAKTERRGIVDDLWVICLRMNLRER